MSSSYDDRVREQAAQYQDSSCIHGVNDARNYLRDRVVQPALQEFLHARNHITAYARLIERAARVARGRTVRIASIGCGAADLEEKVARSLISRGVEGFEFTCLDIAPNLLNEGRERLAADLEGRFELIECDLNKNFPEGPLDVVMAHHSLHHIVGLETLFDAVAEALTAQGVFASFDVIGRNGHRLWPDAACVVEAFWGYLPERLRYDNVLGRSDGAYVDFDCSKEGFEGIRAQAILPNLLERFRPEVFVGYGGVTDPFVSKRFGPNYDMAADFDAFVIGSLVALGGQLNREYWVKPTRMLGVFRPRSWDGQCQGNLAPDRCVHPAWKDE